MTDTTAIPVGQIKWLIDRIHVGTTDLEVARDMWRRMSSAAWPMPTRKPALAVALARHHANRAQYVHVTRGHIVALDCTACHTAAAIARNRTATGS